MSAGSVRFQLALSKFISLPVCDAVHRRGLMVGALIYLVDRKPVERDVVRAWSRRAAAENLPTIVLRITDRPDPVAMADRGASEVLTVRGSAAQLVRWATGRGGAGVDRADGGPAPVAPRWL